METFWKAVAAALIAAILGLTLGKKDFSLVLSMAVCCMAAAAAAVYIEPVLKLLKELEAVSGLDGGMVTILLKSTGIGLVTSLAAMICQDAGNASLAKTMHMLGTGAVLYLSVPVFRAVLELLRDILGGI